jgi:hypothetical protein
VEGRWERLYGGLFLHPHLSMREALAKMDLPCPCFVYEDDGHGEESCECSHVLDEHYDNGQGPKACTVNHAQDCPLDHGDGPCLTLISSEPGSKA